MKSHRLLALAAAMITALPVADAAAVDTTALNYQCRLPLIGNQGTNLWIEIRDDAPVIAGQASTPFPVTNAIRSTGLGAVLAGTSGAVSIKGTITNSLTVHTAQGFALPAKVALQVPEAPLNNPLFLEVVGSMPSLLIDDPGIQRITLDRLAMNLTLLDAAGAPVVLPPGPDVDSDGDPSTFDVTCTLEAGEDPTVGSFEVLAPSSTPAPTPLPTAPPTTGPTAKYSYALQGSTALNTLTKGELPLSGSVDATLALTTGDVVADLKLNDTQARLTALGFIPVTAAVGFVSSGKTTGKLVDDQLTTSSKVRIKIKSVKAFGAIPLTSGNTCQSKQLSEIALKSTDSFDPTGTGGTLAGTYAISDLNGCGPLQGLVSPITAGGGNTIKLKLTPVAQPAA